MSDLSIPGVTDTYNTQKIIDALMSVKREPLTRMQKEVDLEGRQKTAWQDMTRKLSGLRDSARALFGFQNPFNDRIAGSSDEKSLTAAATRAAVEETKNITVRQVATADRFLSRSLPRDFTVDAGTYVFRVGDKEARISFGGGSLKDFVAALNARGGPLVQASLVNDTKDTQVLLVEGKLTGAKNRLSFLESAAPLAVKAGMLERALSGSRPVTLDPKGLAAWTTPLDAAGYSLQNGTLTLNPGSELKIPVSPSAALNPNMVLELSVKTERIPDQPLPEVKPPPGPAVPPTGSVEFGGVKIQSEPSRAPLPEWQPPKPPEKISDMQVLFMEGDGKTIALPELADSADFQRVQVPVGDLASAIDALDLRNRNTNRRIVLKDISLFDKTQRGDYVPTKTLSQAGDAVLLMDGIEVTRAANTVDDLLPGVTLTLKAPSAAPVEVSVTHDIEGIKKQVISLIGAYDRIITDIDVLTRKDATIIDAADYLSDDEKKKSREDLGLLFGDLSLQQLKNSLQTTMMNPYPTSLGADMRLLAQIGISTDVRALGSASIDKTKLRGYIEVDEQKLTRGISLSPEAVKQLFGNDTDGDLVVNAGVAYSLDTLLRPYVQTAGIFPQRVTNLDAKIARNNHEITDYKATLDDYQAELKKKYGQMQGALDTLNKNSQTIQNFNTQNQNQK